jgi:hypothetical protein
LSHRRRTEIISADRDHSTRDWFAGVAIAAGILFGLAAALGWLAS